MASRPPKACAKCGTAFAGSRCPVCAREYKATRKDTRGSASARGYGKEHRQRFRAEVLKRDPVCTCTDPECPVHYGQSRCMHLSTVADHHPLTKRELIEQGLDDNDPQYGRGLCERCHNRSTATDPRTIGGWAQKLHRGDAGASQS